MAGGNRQLGSYIQERREAAGLSLRDLEAATGIPRGGLSLIERGERGASSVMLQRIAEGLGIDYEDLYAVSGVVRPEKLPELNAYLRTRYSNELTAKDRKSLEHYFDELLAKRKRGRRG